MRLKRRLLALVASALACAVTARLGHRHHRVVVDEAPVIPTDAPAHVAPAPAAQRQLSACDTVFINELHYDDSGTDENEMVEIAGPAGTDLTGWSLVLYDGRGGVVYRTVALSGVLGDDSNGYGFLAVPIIGIQDRNEGIALVDASDGVVEFLSYEGELTASDGPAAGMAAERLPWFEDGTSEGTSLQMYGSGLCRQDFSWDAPHVAASPGAANSAQAFGPDPGPPLNDGCQEMWINEVHYDNSGADQDEFIELAAAAGTDLAGWQIYLYDKSGYPYKQVELSGVVGDDTGTGFGFATSYISGIRDGNRNAIAIITPGGYVYDFVSYEGAWADDRFAIAGPATGTQPKREIPSQASNTPVGFSMQMYGAGSCREHFTWDDYTLPETAGAPSRLQVLGADPGAPVDDGCRELFINELHYDDDSADENEFVELVGPAGLDLAGYQLHFVYAGGGTYKRFDLSGTFADAGSGLGVLAFAVPDIQDGGRDGIAILNKWGYVEEFISYEGITTALLGPAKGHTSEPLPVYESSNTAEGMSLQLFGTGLCKEAFTWDGPVRATPGLPNALQVLDADPGQPVGGGCRDLFINELHYANSGADLNEFVELVGPAGLNLTGYQLHFINGGDGKVYKRVDLNGTFVDGGAGLGVLSFTVPGIQNSRDGIALINKWSYVEQFISYEGVVTSVDGPANGTASVPLPRSESGDTAEGMSLQLFGAGLCQQDFTWDGPIRATPGLPNTLQVLGADPGPPADGGCRTFFINELHYDDTGSEDAYEFVELTGSAGLDLDGYQIHLIDGRDGEVYQRVDLNGTFSDEFNGRGFLAFLIPGMANGREAIAVINKWGYAEQVLSYEGNVTVADGPAAGMKSTSIPLSENGDTAEGMSLQLYGTGLCQHEFTWDGPIPDTRGAMNTLQQLAADPGPPVDDGCAKVFINEIHYDDSSADEGEMVELAGPAGFDLTGYMLVLYDGRDGLAYKRVALNGTFADDANGFGFRAVYIEGIENGGNDGIAVVNAGGHVLEFLSYEGNQTAVDGPAKGMTSEEIPARESGAGAAGYSLQLFGAGKCKESFTWDGPIAHTPGRANSLQFFGDDPGPPDHRLCHAIYVNEIHYENAAEDEGEFVEIAAPAGTDLAGAQIILYGGSDGKADSRIDLNGTFTDQQNGYGFLAFDTPGIRNRMEAVAIVNRYGYVEDLVSYEGTFDIADGPAKGATTSAIAVKESSSTPAGYSLQLYGKGFCREDFTWDGPLVATRGTQNTLQRMSAARPKIIENRCHDVFINEVHYEDAAADDGEFVEVAGPAGTDFTGWQLLMYAPDGDVHDRVDMSGAVDDEGNGYGALTFLAPGLGNRAGYGVAVADDGATIVDFVSWEGELTAKSGPAAGLAAERIPVSESDSLAEGYSLQRTGTGFCREDMTWIGPALASNGSINNQTFACTQNRGNLALGVCSGVFINEFDPVLEAGGAGHVAEVAAPAGTDLTGYKVVLYRRNDGASYMELELAGVVAEVAAGVGFATATADLDALLAAGLPDAVALVNAAGAVLEFISVRGSFVATSGPAASQATTDIGVFEGTGTAAGHSLQRTGDGTCAEDFAWRSPMASTFGGVSERQILGAAEGNASRSVFFGASHEMIYPNLGEYEASGYGYDGRVLVWLMSEVLIAPPDEAYWGTCKRKNLVHHDDNARDRMYLTSRTPCDWEPYIAARWSVLPGCVHGSYRHARHRHAVDLGMQAQQRCCRDCAVLNGEVYASLQVLSNEVREVTVGFVANDAGILWVNGRRAFTDNVCSPAVPSMGSHVNVEFREGWNDIVVMVRNHGDRSKYKNHGFVFQLPHDLLVAGDLKLRTTPEKAVAGFAAEDLCHVQTPADAPSVRCGAEDLSTHGSHLSQAVALAFLATAPAAADVSLVHAGASSGDVPHGAVFADELHKIVGEGAAMATHAVTGAEIKAALEEAVAGGGAAYPYAAGLAFDVDMTQPIGGRISNLRVDPRLGGSFAAIDAAAAYTLVASAATVARSAALSGLGGGAWAATGLNDADAVRAYIDGVPSRELARPAAAACSTQSFTAAP